MAGIIFPTLLQLKTQVDRFLSVAWLKQVLTEAGLSWRETPLALPNLIALFARQILAGNLSMPELIRLAGVEFTPEAYCTARNRLPLELLRDLLRRTCSLAEQVVCGSEQTLWKGHRLWHMDGSSFSMSDTPALQGHFGQSGRQRLGCGFPTAHLLCLFDVASGMIQDCIVSPLRTGDMTYAAQLHSQLRRGDILVADRAFESYCHLALLQEQGLHAVLPAHQRRLTDFRRKVRRCRDNRSVIERERVRKCGHHDQIVRWTKPRIGPRWISQKQYDRLPQTITVREIRRTIRLSTGRQQIITMITTLLDEKLYPAEELLEVLKGRWAVELNLRHLKTTMKMDVLRSKSVAGVQRELWMFLIIYNLVRLIMLEASSTQQVAVSRVSFADALYWVRHGDLRRPVPRLQLVPHRPGRIEPRAVKRRPKHFNFLSRHREVFRSSLRVRP